ncbi:MAG: hypothetical protein EOM40_16465 [Clostridia bacterium]|nr:hypothetical protein [Clostridia bacterium]NCC44942.1 hypothetical protein [Clostridia bacterium]
MKRHKEHTLKDLQGKARLQYLWDYYKLHFLILGILLYVIIYMLYGHFTKKENILYVAFANVNVGETLSEQLIDDYISYCDLNTKKNQIYTYQDLYVTSDPADDDYQYAYASSTRVLAAIDSQRMDLVFLNEEALDILVEKNYLSDLTQVLPANEAADNASPFALNVTGTRLFKDAGFTEDVYIGLLKNTPRKEEAIKYIQYILQQ